MKEVNPQETTRAYAFDMWMKAPMPMVTFFKTLDVSHLLKISRKKDMKFNMLMCYCIGRAASAIKEFYLLPVEGKLMQYDTIAVNDTPEGRAKNRRTQIIITPKLDQFLELIDKAPATDDEATDVPAQSAENAE